ncbi:MAG: hypothetical protein HY043_09940 [Verrucomicrobia bacterium]|nr:hypothetical protein [Verrucomicrobiota bacterium]
MPALVLAQPPGPNTPPTISKIADQTTPESTDTALIPFTIFDLETPATNLILSASSSNPQLVPNENIFISQGGTNRWMFATPALCQAGTVNITVTVQDADGATASRSFKLAVTFLNSLPTITSITNQVAIASTTVGPLSFQVFGVAGCPLGGAGLVVDGYSSNTNLVLNSNIVLGGSGTNRTVTITPLPDQTGQTLITIFVTDKDGASSSTQFNLTVISTNQPPRISLIANQILNGNGAGLVNFQVSDEETAVTDLEVMAASSDSSLIPEASFQFSGSGTNRTLYFESALCKYGASIVTVTVRDTGGAVASTSFFVGVQACNGTHTISRIEDRIISANTTDGPFVFRVGAACGCSGKELQLSGASSNTNLVPNENIQFAGTGSERRALIIPVPDQVGVANLTFTVSDGSLSVSTTFKVTVVPAPSINITNQQFHFTQSLPPGNVVIEASTNLVAWLPVATNSVAGGVLNFTDVSASNFVARFYRLTSPTITP